MLAWLPSIVSLLIGILGQLNAADWVAAHPQLAMGLGTLGALITALTKSPIAPTEPPKPPLSGGRPFLFVILFVLITAPAFGQTVTVDLNKASLAWDWAKGAPPNDGDATGFTAHCGRTSGVYSANTPINDAAARTVPIRSIVNGQGLWFCAVSAFNRYGTSSNKTNEVSFDAGALPADPARARVQAQ